MADTQAESRTTGLRARGAETRGPVEAVNAMVRQPRPNKHHARSNAGCSADVQGGERDVRQMRLWFRSLLLCVVSDNYSSSTLQLGVGQTV